MGSGIIGQPITFRGPDGKQYVSVLSGVVGLAGVIVSGELDPRDNNIALGVKVGDARATSRRIWTRCDEAFPANAHYERANVTGSRNQAK
ncbi:hypothetical protein [Corallococcus sp. AB045]|uniref:hypothetical protein n=1 Tax=Corallococcus sp. AB045 TaxID=2316719 RepID=UPI0018F628E3|nr:hypothetical protein [Corallococcus sp. AB045]